MKIDETERQSSRERLPERNRPGFDILCRELEQETFAVEVHMQYVGSTAKRAVDLLFVSANQSLDSADKSLSVPFSGMKAGIGKILRADNEKNAGSTAAP